MGFSTVEVLMPPAEAKPEKAMEPPSDEGCLVPRLKGRTLKRSRMRLKEAGCEIGAVRKLGSASAKTGKVVRQHPKPGDLLAPGANVSVTLGTSVRR